MGARVSSLTGGSLTLNHGSRDNVTARVGGQCPDRDPDEPTAVQVRAVIGIIMAILAIFLMVFLFLNQTTTIRAVEFGASVVLFILSIVQIVL